MPEWSSRRLGHIGSCHGIQKWSGARLAEVKRISGKDKRGELARERLAEEALEFASNTTSTLETLSVITNLQPAFTSRLIRLTKTGFYGLLAATTSFLPWLFPNVYHTTYEKHLEYKKKIYAPLVSMGLEQQAGANDELDLELLGDLFKASSRGTYFTF